MPVGGQTSPTQGYQSLPPTDPASSFGPPGHQRWAGIVPPPTTQPTKAPSLTSQFAGLSPTTRVFGILGVILAATVTIVAAVVLLGNGGRDEDAFLSATNTISGSDSYKLEVGHAICDDFADGGFGLVAWSQYGDDAEMLEVPATTYLCPEFSDKV